MMDIDKNRSPIAGLHHITAIAGDPQRNLDFYTSVLGLRLIKITVDYEDPAIYHLYYGVGDGAPGTLITFFIYLDGQPGRRGAGLTDSIAFAIPAHALGHWIDRFIDRHISFEGPFKRNGLQTITLRDPDGLQIELVAVPSPGLPGAEFGIQRLHSVTLWEAEPNKTEAFLTGVLGLRLMGSLDGVQFYAVDSSPETPLLQIRSVAGFWSGVVGIGSVHHVAWQVADEAALTAWQIHIGFAGATVSPIRNRFYFQSIYFPEPGGVLFELATTGSGFTLDEPADRLGESLRLPPWFESRRPEIERGLPPLQLPSGQTIPPPLLSKQPTSTDTYTTGKTGTEGEQGMTVASAHDPHAHQRVLLAGEPLERAHSAVILLHGRGARADDILSLAGTLNVPGFTFLAPQAAGNTWYPHSFLYPLEENEPYLSSALGTVESVLSIVTESKIPVERTFILGFSQGACLCLEFVARYARRYGGAIAFTGGLIGPDSSTERLFRLARRNAGLHRRQRHRPSRSACAASRIGYRARKARWDRRSPHLPRHGPHHQRRRARSREGHA